tara:strand:- start:1012 stop:1473 length:462 start_codon:yes stop_codon:yes gene_type:complete
MEQIFSTICINTSGIGFTDITDRINYFIKENKFVSGILIINLLHTSCSLTVNENADPNVLTDLQNYIEAIVPNNSVNDLTKKRKEVFYKHYQEGEDDMPAHIKTALTNTSLSFSFQNEKLLLGVWQAIYLWEHRFGSNQRNLNLHVIGEKKNI